MSTPPDLRRVIRFNIWNGRARHAVAEFSFVANSMRSASVALATAHRVAGTLVDMLIVKSLGDWIPAVRVVLSRHAAAIEVGPTRNDDMAQELLKVLREAARVIVETSARDAYKFHPDEEEAPPLP